MVPIAVVAVLFTRLDGVAVLAHDARRRLIEVVQARPGAHLAEVASAMGIDPSTVAYHARQLERVGRLRLERDGRALRCYPPGHRPSRRDDPRVHLALWAIRLGATGPAGVARALRIPRGTAGSLLGRLLERGMVVRAPGGLRPAVAEPFSRERDLGGP